jgi:hypothetical protein
MLPEIALLKTRQCAIDAECLHSILSKFYTDIERTNTGKTKIGKADMLKSKIATVPGVIH